MQQTQSLHLATSCNLRCEHTKVCTRPLCAFLHAGPASSSRTVAASLPSGQHQGLAGFSAGGCHNVVTPICWRWHADSNCNLISLAIMQLSPAECPSGCCHVVATTIVCYTLASYSVAWLMPRSCPKGQATMVILLLTRVKPWKPPGGVANSTDVCTWNFAHLCLESACRPCQQHKSRTRVPVKSCSTSRGSRQSNSKHSVGALREAVTGKGSKRV